MLYTLVRMVRSKWIFRLMYWVTRIGMGFTFVISGLRKMPGVLFTILPPDDPVGAYFHAMHETGMYWHFIGYFQIIIGILLLVNRFAPLAILLMIPVTVNIFLVSVGLHMRGTTMITFSMLLGNMFLLFWHFEHFVPLLRTPDRQTTRLKSSD